MGALLSGIGSGVASGATNAIANSPVLGAASNLSEFGPLDADFTLEPSGAARGLAGGGASSLQQAGLSSVAGSPGSTFTAGGFNMLGSKGAVQGGQDAISQLLGGLQSDVSGFSQGIK